tara:strand:- start:178 stop:564 length:387 start_codon:yes stop_codon:yes gene_type:complete
MEDTQQQQEPVFPKYCTAVVERNIRTRMSSLRLEIRHIAEALDITKPAIYKRMARLSEVDIYWWSTVLVVHPEHLIHPLVIHTASSPPLVDGWIDRVKHLIGEPFDYDAVLNAAFDDWQDTTMQGAEY